MLVFEYDWLVVIIIVLMRLSFFSLMVLVIGFVRCVLLVFIGLFDMKIIGMLRCIVVISIFGVILL